MATNPLISLQGRGIDVSSIYSNALTNLAKKQALEQAQAQAPIQNRLLEAQTAGAEAKVPTAQAQVTAQQKERISSAALASRDILPDLQSGNIENATQKLQRHAEQLQSSGADNSHILRSIELAKTNPQELLRAANNAIALDTQINPRKATSGGLASAKTEILPGGSTIQALPSGEVEVRNPLGNVVAGQERLDVIRQAQELKQEQARTKAALTVETAGKTEQIKQKQQRTSEITKEISTRNREAARSSRGLRKALTLAKQASQGLTGAAKLQLSRLIPGIDASNEAGLDAALKELALDQLQKFKGPTTDFEFGVTQSIAGSLGQSQSANIARIKSLDRAQWFNQKEFNQFDKFVKSGGNPDSFRFNFGEPVKTKKGIFTLQDIQDTAVQHNLTIEETIKRLNQ